MQVCTKHLELAAVVAQCYSPKANKALIRFVLHGSMPQGRVAGYLRNNNRLGTFIGQLAHESAGMTRLVENLNYRPSTMLKVFPKYVRTKAQAERLSRDRKEFANTVYGGRMGNLPSEGYRYRGRCPIMLTGADNYRKYGGLIGEDLLRDPDKALDLRYGYAISLAYFIETGTRRSNLLELADNLSHKKVSKLINGGYHGLADRIQRSNKAIEALDQGVRVLDDLEHKDLCKVAQYYLKKLGKYSGRIDGIIGRGSRAALSELGCDTRISVFSVSEMVEHLGEV